MIVYSGARLEIADWVSLTSQDVIVAGTQAGGWMRENGAIVEIKVRFADGAVAWVPRESLAVRGTFESQLNDEAREALDSIV